MLPTVLMKETSTTASVLGSLHVPVGLKSPLWLGWRRQVSACHRAVLRRVGDRVRESACHTPPSIPLQLWSKGNSILTIALPFGNCPHKRSFGINGASTEGVRQVLDFLTLCRTL